MDIALDISLDISLDIAFRVLIRRNVVLYDEIIFQNNSLFNQRMIALVALHDTLIITRKKLVDLGEVGSL